MKLFFRVRIAIISFAVSGTLLAAFGIAFFAMTYSSGIDRIDREIRSLVEAPLRGGHPDHYWYSFGRSMDFIYGDERDHRMVLVVLSRSDDLLFRSSDAPEALLALPRPEPPPMAGEPPVTEDAPPPAPSPEQTAEALMQRLDRNNDQQLDWSEFDGPRMVFELSDINDDGFINLEEAGRMDMLPQRRQRRRGPFGPGEGRGRGPGPGRTGPPPTVSKYHTFEAAGTTWRAGIFSSSEVTLLAAMDLNAFQAELRTLRNAFVIAVPGGLLLLGFAGWFLAGRAMKPVAVIAETAEGITARGLNQRIPKVGHDIELERLVNVSNDMLDRLEKSYHQAVRFSADAAHELQTPLTILQGELDNALQSADAGSEEQQRCSRLLEELRNLKAVVQKLLLLAHADEGRLNLNRQPIDLGAMITDAVEDMEIMAPELDVEARIEPDVMVGADAPLLNQVIRNMTSNAAKYASSDGRAVFALSCSRDEVRFTLANTAEPIPDADRPLLFDRFHRVDKARTAAGSGLGLSLAREIARAHGGDLTLDPYADGMVSFTLTLPMR